MQDDHGVLSDHGEEIIFSWFQSTISIWAAKRESSQLEILVKKENGRQDGKEGLGFDGWINGSIVRPTCKKEECGHDGKGRLGFRRKKEQDEKEKGLVRL
ncbi:hypothetical protein Cni_G15161 [Canna indica]|uniref:Uncharacterized protein n=1 Tax=Canna indica TaxID=4628 RepID=A0AAQ3KDK2_9LILI|nr:hypothetical protein Cni_G15161 [Canna indica]